MPRNTFKEPAATVSIKQHHLGRAYYGKQKSILKQIEALGVSTLKIDARRGTDASILIFGPMHLANQAANMIQDNIRSAEAESSFRKTKREEVWRANRDYSAEIPKVHRVETKIVESVNPFAAFDNECDETPISVWITVDVDGNTEKIGSVFPSSLTEVEGEDTRYNSEYGILHVTLDPVPDQDAWVVDEMYRAAIEKQLRDAEEFLDKERLEIQRAEELKNMSAKKRHSAIRASKRAKQVANATKNSLQYEIVKELELGLSVKNPKFDFQSETNPTQTTVDWWA